MSGKRLIAGVAAVFCLTALTAFAGIARADAGGWGCGQYGRHGHHDFKKIAEKLGLTDTQKAQAKTIFQANKDVVKPIYASLRAERKNLQALIYADTVDEAAIRSETAKVAAIQADLNVNRAKVTAQFRAILTPDQLTTLKALHQKHQNGVGATPTTPPAPAQ
ncbi:MAG TPA: Spy/CpxP family protein refolding chaperone [Geobacteraceae bacterium]|nr:Spy/CpxP family protein refolding chaperone [Geobacteraceae bacterium]